MDTHVRSEEAYRLMHDGILALARAERQGIRVDMEYVERKRIQLARRMQQLEDSFKATSLYRHWEHSTKGKVNINSGVQLGNFLYGVKKIEPIRFTDTGKGSTDEEALQELAIPELEFLVKRNKYKKALDVLEAFAREQVDGYIHPFFNLHLVRTFRSSSDSPNFQNIPKRDAEMYSICRKALFPRPGHQLLEVDYGQLEVRISYCYNRDPKLEYDIIHGDMHADMAREIFLLDSLDKSRSDHKVLRQAAKNGFVFPQFYGDYFKNCATNIANGWCKLPKGKWSKGMGVTFEEGNISDYLISKGIKSFSAFENHIKRIETDFWEKRYPDYTAWKDRWYETYKKYGYIDMFTGFRCWGPMSRNDSINYPVQGAAFHCLLWSFIQLDKLLLSEGLQSRLIGQIHDSMILDVLPEELEYLKEKIHKITCEDLPATWKWIIIPLEVDMEVYPVDSPWIEEK